MRRITVPALAVACVVLVATASCTPSSVRPSAESRSAGASISAPATSFERLGYRFDMPKGWLFQQGSEAWEATGGPPRITVPAFDAFLSPGTDPRILVGERPVRDGAPLAQWITEM